MKSAQWKKKIISACEGVGTYKKEFDTVIDTLSSVLESRDKVYEQFITSGGNAVINYTNKGGRTNLVKNPLMTSWLDLNAQALTYWRDLGLTPSGLKKITGENIKPNEKKSSLAEILKELK